MIDHIFEKISSIENIFSAWREFRRGKLNKPDVEEFNFNLENNLFAIREQLVAKTYIPDEYAFFYVRDPKLRPIHKASVRDRVVFQAVFRVLYHIFDRTFIYDSYACRFGKGTHQGVLRLTDFLRKTSKNYRHQTFVLKCDIQKFFYSIDHAILFKIIQRKVKDPEALDLIQKIINSFHISPSKGLPLGNVTSQLFANICLNEPDQFVKHILKEKQYIRYCDDFVIVGSNRDHLASLIPRLAVFLQQHLQLILHPRKVEIRKLSQGVDFLGYVMLKRHRVLRTRTKQRILKKMRQKIVDYIKGELPESYLAHSMASYQGVLRHCNSFKLSQELIKFNPATYPTNTPKIH